MPENQNIEWKESWRDEYLKWICGFANAQGGKIYIGTNDNGEVVGVKDSKKLLEDIPNKIVSTLGIVADVNLLQKNGLDYIEIIVSVSPYPVSYHGEFHYRTGSTKQLLTGAALSQFLLEKTGLTWDGIPIDGVSADDLETKSFDIFREQAVKSKRIDPYEDLGPRALQLENLNLLVDNRLTRAAVLMFHHKPEKWVPGAFVKIGYFENEANVLYQDEVHGSLLEQVDEVIDLIYTKYLKGIISYDDITRVTTYPYPRNAVRELVLNAIAHKNYSLMIPIQIKIFPDHMVISNDCVFPKDWTVSDLLGPHRSIPHNPMIAYAFYRAGFIESWGQGIQKVRESCLENENEFPDFKVVGGDITVSLKANKMINEIELGVNTQSTPNNTQSTPDNSSSDKKQEMLIEELIVEYIRKNPCDSQTKTAKAIDKNVNAVKSAFLRLRERGKIKWVGENNRNGKWVVND